MALYDAIASIYDPWSASVVEDIEFYVEEALGSGGPVVELAVGTGRVAVPIAKAGIRVIGIDQSEHMLATAREYARAEGVESLLELRLGDLREPEIDERVPLVICPFRSLLHMPDDAEKIRALDAARMLLEKDGRLIFDVFCPSPDDIEETHGRWLEREPGILERADWDKQTRTLALSVKGEGAEATMNLHWATPEEWHQLLDRAGFELEALYGWFDRRPFKGGEDTIWVATAR